MYASQTSEGQRTEAKGTAARGAGVENYSLVYVHLVYCQRNTYAAYATTMSLHICSSSQSSLLQQPGPKKLKLSKIELIYKAKKFRVLPFAK